MRELELRQHAVCNLCRRKIGASGLPLFWRVTIERFGVDLRAIERQDGLGACLSNSMLANMMGPDEDLAKQMMDPVKLTICETCAAEDNRPLMVLADCGPKERSRDATV